MHRRSGSLLFPLAICLCTGSGLAAEPQELPALRAVRSLAAETAQVLRLESDGRVTMLYADMMRQDARDQLLQMDESSGSRDPVLHQAVSDSVSALDRKDAAMLRAIADRLFGMAGPRGPTD